MDRPRSVFVMALVTATWPLAALGAPSGETMDVPFLGQTPVFLAWTIYAVGGAIGLGVFSSMVGWVLKKPCGRCGSRNVRYTGSRGRGARSRRCVNCGWANE